LISGEQISSSDDAGQIPWDLNNKIKSKKTKQRIEKELFAKYLGIQNSIKLIE
jgi:hypothetical protein